MKRVMSFGVLLFSYALVILGYQQQSWWYKGLGIAAIAASIFFLTLAARRKWSEWGDKVIDGWMYLIWFVIFIGLFILTFLKGYVSVVNAGQPSLIQNGVFGIGWAMIVYIAIIAIVNLPRRKK